jgi:pimeloyl-ACP methyl ester carboxylesterase
MDGARRSGGTDDGLAREPSGPLSAGPTDLPPDVASVLADPPPAAIGATEAAGIRFAWLAWGTPDAPPVLLLHGVGSSAGTFWRLGPAVAASGRRVVAIDQAGHGRTGGWRGHHRFVDNAADVAAFAVAAGLVGGGRPPGGPAATDQGLAVLGHSWGAATAAALPAAGLVPARIILLDPPVAPLARMRAMADDPSEQGYPDLATARAAVRAANPGWDPRDIEAKALALHRLDPAAVRSVLVLNGDWDGGLADLAHPSAAAIPVWVIRGEPGAGGLVPDDAVPRLAERVGADRVITIASAGHSPQRDAVHATTLAVLRALA